MRVKAIEYLSKATEAAHQILQAFSNKPVSDTYDFEDLDKFNSKYYNNDIFLERLLPLYDAFLCYGRIFSHKQLKMLVKKSLNQDSNMRYKIITILQFLNKYVWRLQ